MLAIRRLLVTVVATVIAVAGSLISSPTTAASPVRSAMTPDSVLPLTDHDQALVTPDTRSDLELVTRVSGRPRVIVQRTIGRAGGTVRARNGAKIRIPKGVLRHRAIVSISRIGAGRFDYHIAGAWSGRVGVTLPRVPRSRVAAHKIANQWLPEGRPGQRTVWVSQLSLFDTIKKKAKAATCFYRMNKTKVIECLIQKLGEKVDSEIVNWVADKLGGSCVAAVATSGHFALLTALLDPVCVGRAGEEFEFASGPQPSPPSNPQSPAANPNPPAPTPGPAPAPGGIAVATTSNYLVPPWRGGSPLNVRSAPSTSAAVAYTIPTGTIVHVSCQTAGTPIGASGQYPGNSTWNRLTDGNWIHDALTESPGGIRVDLGGGNFAYYSPGWPRC